MAMTLEQVRNRLRAIDHSGMSGDECDDLADAIDTHLFHPAQAVDVARRFHETYERLAPSFGYETRHETRVFDPESPNGKLMIAVCAEITRAHIPQPKQGENSHDQGWSDGF